MIDVRAIRGQYLISVKLSVKLLSYQYYFNQIVIHLKKKSNTQQNTEQNLLDNPHLFIDPIFISQEQILFLFYILLIR